MGGWIYTGLKVAACMKRFTNSWAPNNFVMATSTSPSPKHPHRRPPTAPPFRILHRFCPPRHTSPTRVVPFAPISALTPT